MPRKQSLRFIFVWILMAVVQQLAAQASTDFAGKWTGYMKVNETPLYRIFIDFTNVEAKQVRGSISFYDYNNPSQAVKSETVTLQYDKQKKIAFYNTGINNPAGSECVGWLILKIDAGKAGFLETTFRTSKECMAPGIVLARPAEMDKDPVFAAKGPAPAPTGTVTGTAATPPPAYNGTVKIKADRLTPFNEGLAIVRFGSADGIINNTGSFVVPYNQYNIAEFGLGSLEPEHGFINGGCVVRKAGTQLLGMIDARGKLIIPCEYMLVYPFDADGWSRVTDMKDSDFFINRAGAKVPVLDVFYVYRSSVVSPNGGI